MYLVPDTYPATYEVPACCNVEGIVLLCRTDDAVDPTIGWSRWGCMYLQNCGGSRFSRPALSPLVQFAYGTIPFGELCTKAIPPMLTAVAASRAQSIPILPEYQVQNEVTRIRNVSACGPPISAQLFPRRRDQRPGVV